MINCCYIIPITEFKLSCLLCNHKFQGKGEGKKKKQFIWLRLRNIEKNKQASKQTCLPLSPPWEFQNPISSSIIQTLFSSLGRADFLSICLGIYSLSPSSVQLLSRVQLVAAPRTVAHQAPLSITNFHSLLKLSSIESVIDSISSSAILSSFCHQSFPALGSFSRVSSLHQVAKIL